MSEFLLYMLFSVLETCSMYYLMFRMFKIDLYGGAIVFASVIGSYISYTLRVGYELEGTFDIIVQVLLMVAFVWLLFKIHIFYAFVMTAMVYVSYVILQLSLYYVMNVVLEGFFDRSALEPGDYSIHLLQTVTAALTFIIGWLVYQRKGGLFDFVPHSDRETVSLRGINAGLFALSVLTFGFISLLYYFFSPQDYVVGSLLVFCSVCVTALFALLLLAYRKDRSNGDH